MRSNLLFLSILTSCATQGSWTFDNIPSGNVSYDLTRLIYQNKEEFSPLRLELIKMGKNRDLILSFPEYRIIPTNPEGVIVRFSIDDQPAFEETIPLNQGNMRLHLSQMTAEKIIKGLQEGFKIDIVVDDVKERISPDLFIKNYEKFMKKGFF